MKAARNLELARKNKGSLAAKYYNRAGLLYSCSDKRLAGLCFKLGGQELEYENKKYYAAEFYIKSGLQYKNFDLNEAILLFNKAIALFVSRKYYRIAANNLELLTELNVKNKMIVEAIDNLRRARKYYLTSNLKDNAFKCLDKISSLYINNEDYEKALLTLEQMYKIKKSTTIYFNIAVLRLYLNADDCNKYLNTKRHHIHNIEYIILSNLANAMIANNKHAFVKTTNQYIHKFTKWRLSIIKKTLNTF